jgi:4-oxalocrotonate tautomerase
MPIVTVHLWPGRTPETKSKIIKAVTHSLAAAASIPPSAVRVLLIEVPLENWGTAGVPASERAPEE